MPILAGTVETPTTPSPQVEAPLVGPRQEHGRGLAFTWTGTNGQSWSLSHSAGRSTLMAGATGLEEPPVDSWRLEPAATDGAAWLGGRVKPREVFLPVQLVGSSDVDYLSLSRGFLGGLDYRALSTLTVNAPDGGGPRSLRLRYDGGSEGAHSYDPVKHVRSVHGLRFVAEDPYWKGATVTIAWTGLGTAALDFFNGAPKAPVFNISAPQVTGGTVQVDNPGDVSAWPRWSVSGPFTAVVLGVGTQTLTWTPAAGYTVGQVLSVDTAPGVRSIIGQNGARAWDRAAVGSALAPLPPGVSTVVVNVTGATADTSVTVNFEPRFRRGW